VLEFTNVYPLDTITIDSVVELPDAHGYDTIMNMANCIAKHAHFMPTQTTVSAEGTAQLYLVMASRLSVTIPF
jgi:hypothetical protein